MSAILAVATIITAGGGLGSALGAIRVEQPPDAAQVQSQPNQPFPQAQAQNPQVQQPIAPQQVQSVADDRQVIDMGIAQSASGGLVGTIPGGLTCDDPGTLRVQTDTGSVTAGISQEGGWSCQATLTQWRQVSSQGTEVGVRYKPGQGADPGSMTIVNENGRSMTLPVHGSISLPTP